MYQKIIKYIIYGLVALMPLFWLPFSFETFEFNKGYLLFFLVAIGFLVWLAKMIFKDKQIVFRRTRLDFVVLGFAVLMILSVVFSKDKAASIYGFYGRFWPSLVGILSLAGFYFLLTNNVGIKPQIPKNKNWSFGIGHWSLVKVFLISSAVVVLITYLSVFGSWQFLNIKLPLIVLSQTFNPLSGSLESLSIFLAFLTVLLIGLLAFSKRDKTRFLKHLLLAAALGLLVIIDFWPAWFVLGFSLFLFLAFSFWKRLFKTNVERLTLPVLLFIIALIFLLTNPLQGLISQSRLIGNLPKEIQLKQGASWRLAWEGIKGSPIFGSGLSNFSYAFSKYRPATFLENNPLWYLRLDRAGNHIAEWVATTGVLGVLAYLSVVVLFLLFALRDVILKESKATEESPGKQRDSSACGPRMTIGMPLLMAFLALVIAQFVYYQNTALAFSFWLILGLAAANWQQPRETDAKLTPSLKKLSEEASAKIFSFKTFPEIGLVFSIIFWVILVGFAFFSFKLVQNYRADLSYRQYLQNPFQNLEQLKKAAQISSNSGFYHIVLARAYLASFSEELQKSQPDPQTINNMVGLAVEESRKAAQISPYWVAAYETSGVIYRGIQGVAQGAIDWAIKSFEKALELEPKNPVFLTELGRLYLAKGEKEKARQLFAEAISFKKDYVETYLEMAWLEEAEGNLAEAQAQLETAKAQNPSSVEARFQLGRLYYNNNQLDKAEEQFLAALRLFPNHSNSLYSLGLIYERKGETAKALEFFERVLELNPDNADVVSKIQGLE